MEPDGRDCHPHPNDVYVPRMICAQFNNMGYCTILRRVRKQLLEELWRMMASKSPQHFFTIYLAVFMMLHEISVTTRDRYRWAEENNQVSRLMCSPKKKQKRKADSHPKEGYSLAGQVEAIQEGANIILSHWHYYKRGFNPLTTDWKKAKGKKTVWADLTEKEIEYLLEICDFYNSDESHNGTNTLRYGIYKGETNARRSAFADNWGELSGSAWFRVGYGSLLDKANVRGGLAAQKNVQEELPALALGGKRFLCKELSISYDNGVVISVMGALFFFSLSLIHFPS